MLASRCPSRPPRRPLAALAIAAAASCALVATAASGQADARSGSAPVSEGVVSEGVVSEGVVPEMVAPEVTVAAVERSQLHMGTLLTLRVEADDRDAALAAGERAFAAVRDAEARLSTWRDDTELARLNARLALGDAAVAGHLSPALAVDLHVARVCAETTGGAFDPTVGPLVDAWGLRSGGSRPSEADVDEALRSVGWRALDLSASSARSGRQGLRLEEGGFGKGAALDDAVAALAAALAAAPSADRGIQAALLDFGGQLAVYRMEANVAVAHPHHRDRLVAEFRIGTGSVATTGHGERLGHVLDPRTGRPAADFGSVTVWVRSDEISGHRRPATLADCLATGLFVLGADAALDFAARHEEIEVLVAELVGDGVEIRTSTGLEPVLFPGTPSVSETAVPETAASETAASTTAAAAIPAAAKTTWDDEPGAATLGSSPH